MQIHSVGIDLGKTTFHPVASARPATSPTVRVSLTNGFPFQNVFGGLIVWAKTPSLPQKPQRRLSRPQPT